MSLRKKLLIALGALLLAALAVFIARTAQQFSREEKEVTYPSLEVLFNPYLAAEHFLKKQGIKLHRSTRLKEAMRRPPQGKTLLFLAERDGMSDKQSESLLQWASEGGHLIVVAERLWDEDEGASGDLLLDRLGIEQYESKDLSTPRRDGKKAPPYAKLTKIYLKDESSPAYVSFDTRYHLHDEDERAHVWADSENATHILQLYYGDGLITVLSDAWIWNNANIGKYDNAWLLWYLSQEDGDVTLLYALAPHEDSLWDALLKHFPETLVTLALLLVLLLWHLGQRQGTLLPAAPRARRQLLEHLRASGDFLQRRLGRAALVQRLQDDIERRAGVRHAGFATLTQEARWQVLAKLSRQPLRRVQQAMNAPPRKHPRAVEFIQQVARLQDLRNAL